MQGRILRDAWQEKIKKKSFTMEAIIIAVIFYSCSGILDAVMDTLKDHFSVSVFSGLNQQYWNPAMSWKNKYVNGDPAQGHVKFDFLGLKLPFPDALSDAWHTAKILREGFNILAILSMFYVSSNFTWVTLGVTFLSLSIFRNVCFNIFYDKILRK